MRMENYEAWMITPTREINKKYVRDQGLLEKALKNAGGKSEALGGNTTSFDIIIHDRAVEKFQEIGNEILVLIKIMICRQGADLLSPNDLVIDQTLANKLAEARTTVETKIQIALGKVREQTERFKFEKAKHEAEIQEKARMEIANARPVQTPPQAPVLQPPSNFNKIIRFQPINSNRPDVMDLDDDFGKFFGNIDRVEAYYRYMAVPENFSPKSQQTQFMDFVSPTLAIQLRQRLEKKPQATWQMCLDQTS